MNRARRLQRRRWLQVGVAGLAVASGPARARDTSTPQRIRERGALIVGGYNEMPPFHAAGKGRCSAGC